MNSVPKFREVKRSLPIVLLQAREAVMSHFRPMLSRHGVTEQQWRVVRVLAESGVLDASELSRRAFILAPSLTRMIRSLQKRGLITRFRDKGDGRRVLLRLAPAGEALIREVLPDSMRIYSTLEERYGRERLEALVELLGDLTSFRNEAEPQSPSEDD